MSKPREFWITDNTDNSGWTVDTEFNHIRHFGSCNVIHVIEKSHADKLEAALKEAVEALNFYSSNDHWFGPNYEDEKRLFNKIVSEDCHPVTSPDRFVGGKMARDTLARIEEVLK